jgi:hypothetical protein
MKKYVDWMIIAGLTLIVLVVIVAQYKTKLMTYKPWHSNQVAITKISVISGHEFDLTLVDGRRILGHLKITTSKEATKKVVDLFNSITNPVVVLLEKKDNDWVIEIEVSQKGNTVKLTDWLKQQKLVFE